MKETADKPAALVLDNPDHDATDFAHPAWWRGNDEGVKRTVQIVNEILDGNHSRGRFADASLDLLRSRLTNAALSVPAAAVVGEPERRAAFDAGWDMHAALSSPNFGEPVAWTDQTELDAIAKHGNGIIWGAEDKWISQNGEPIPLYAAPSAPDGWQSIETAPHACHVIACYFYECEWIYDVVLSPPSHPFTHWKMLPAPPALGGASHE